MTSTFVTTGESLDADVDPSLTGEGMGRTPASVPAWRGSSASSASSLAGAVYDKTLAGDADGIVDKLAEQTVPILVMHTGAMLSAVLLLVFAAGLRRRLDGQHARRAVCSPQVAAYGLMLVSVALLMGSGLTTEFVFGVQDPDQLVPETAVFFGHWIGTIPWLWVGAGVAALARRHRRPQVRRRRRRG